MKPVIEYALKKLENFISSYTSINAKPSNQRVNEDYYLKKNDLISQLDENDRRDMLKIIDEANTIKKALEYERVANDNNANYASLYASLITLFDVTLRTTYGWWGKFSPQQDLIKTMKEQITAAKNGYEVQQLKDEAVQKKRQESEAARQKRKQEKQAKLSELIQQSIRAATEQQKIAYENEIAALRRDLAASRAPSTMPSAVPSATNTRPSSPTASSKSGPRQGGMLFTPHTNGNGSLSASLPFTTPAKLPTNDTEFAVRTLGNVSGGISIQLGKLSQFAEFKELARIFYERLENYKDCIQKTHPDLIAQLKSKITDENRENVSPLINELEELVKQDTQEQHDIELKLIREQETQQLKLMALNGSRVSHLTPDASIIEKIRAFVSRNNSLCSWKKEIVPDLANEVLRSFMERTGNMMVEEMKLSADNKNVMKGKIRLADNQFFEKRQPAASLRI